MNTATLARIGTLAVVLTLPALAHHGVAPHYDDSTEVTIDGTVAEFQFINPHSFVYLRAVGRRRQGGGLALRAGFAQRACPQRADGADVRHGEARANHRQPRASQPDRLRGARGTFRRRQRAALVDAVRRDAGRDRRARGAEQSIEGVWAMKRFAVSHYIGALTDEGERLRDAFDPIKDDHRDLLRPREPRAVLGQRQRAVRDQA